MTSPFRMNPQLGPNLHQIVRASQTGGVWYADSKQIVSPQLGDRAVGDDGHDYVFVKASATIANASAPGTQVTITEPAMTAAAGAGGFYAPNSAVNTGAAIASGDYFWARRSAL